MSVVRFPDPKNSVAVGRRMLRIDVTLCVQSYRKEWGTTVQRTRSMKDQVGFWEADVPTVSASELSHPI